MSAFERYRATAPRVRMTWDATSNVFEYQACTATIGGQGGDDLLSTFKFSRFCSTSRTHYKVRGGRGDDHPIGSPYRDHLDGGPGIDDVRGHDGVDWCRGETVGGCERP